MRIRHTSKFPNLSCNEKCLLNKQVKTTDITNDNANRNIECERRRGGTGEHVANVRVAAAMSKGSVAASGVSGGNGRGGALLPKHAQAPNSPMQRSSLLTANDLALGGHLPEPLRLGAKLLEVRRINDPGDLAGLALLVDLDLGSR